MKSVTIEAIKALISNARIQANKLQSKKRKTQNEVWKIATLYRDIVEVENYLKTL